MLTEGAQFRFSPVFNGAGLLLPRNLVTLRVPGLRPESRFNLHLFLNSRMICRRNPALSFLSASPQPNICRTSLKDVALHIAFSFFF